MTEEIKKIERKKVTNLVTNEEKKEKVENINQMREQKANGENKNQIRKQNINPENKIQIRENKVYNENKNQIRENKVNNENKNQIRENKVINENKNQIREQKVDNENKMKNKSKSLNNDSQRENGDKIIKNENRKRPFMKTNRPFNKMDKSNKNNEKALPLNMESDIKIENTKTTFIKNTIKNTKNQIDNFEFKKSNLKIIPLGGLEEIGKNITVFEYEDEIVLVDCGLEFPTDDMLGVDLVLPDITYLERNKEKIKGLVITHGHEDHIGSIPYVLKQIDMPIYATRLPIGLISKKLEEHKLLSKTRMNIVEPGQTVNFGKIKIEFIRSNHSIPDAVMFAIHTPVGVVMHTGDFKIDFTPIDDQVMDFGRIAEIGNNGVLALMSDSTNAERKGYTMSESSVGEVFDKLFQNCTKRIVVATFASNVHRVQQILNSAVKYKRKVAVCGRSMINMIETAMRIGYITVPENTFIDIDMIKNYTDDQLTIITTGSQGETMSALTRMAAGEHRKVIITPNDLVIISASPIPGNEKLVSKVIDDLMKIGADVIYSSLEDIHVSGHACQEEQKLILSLVRPKFFIPVHGEYRQLKAHSETAEKMGIPAKNIFMMKNGRVMEINENEAKLTTSVPSGKILVDGLGVGDVGNIVLKDRQHLSQDGLIIIVMTMDAGSGEIVAGPDVISRGFVYVRESENLMDDVKRFVRDEVRNLENQGIKDWSTIKSTLRDELRDYIFQKTKRNPMILPIIMEL